MAKLKVVISPTGMLVAALDGSLVPATGGLKDRVLAHRSSGRPVSVMVLGSLYLAPHQILRRAS